MSLEARTRAVLQPGGWLKLDRTGICVAVLCVLVLSSLLPLVLGVDALAIDPVNRLEPPSFAHPLGTDQLGRDLLWLSLAGGRVSLSIGFMVAAVALVIGTTLGLLAVTARWLDLLLMRIADGLMAIPAILIAVALVAASGAGIFSLVFAIAAPEIPRVMRLVRSAALGLRSAPFVEAARMSGGSWLHVVAVHLLPNTFPLLIVQGTYTVANAILIESGLSFLGLGVPATTPSWGRTIAEGKLLFQLFPYPVLVPGLLLALTVFVINILGDQLRDLVDPKSERFT